MIECDNKNIISKMRNDRCQLQTSRKKRKINQKKHTSNNNVCKMGFVCCFCV